MRLREIRECFKTNQDFIGAVNSALREIAEKNPDFIYRPKGVFTGCNYNRGSGDGPECSGCLFGQAFQMLGWSKGGIDSSRRIIALCNHYDIPYQENWRFVQNAQDGGDSFSEAVKFLDR